MLAACGPIVREGTPRPNNDDVTANPATAQPTPSPPGGPTATALIELVVPSATPQITVQPLPASPTAPPSATAVAPDASGGQLNLLRVGLVRVARVSEGSDQAIATLTLEFSGGQPPYTLRHSDQTVYTGDAMGSFVRDGLAQAWIEFDLATSCGFSLVGGVTLIDSAGEQASLDYFIDRANCP